VPVCCSVGISTDCESQVRVFTTGKLIHGSSVAIEQQDFSSVPEARLDSACTFSAKLLVFEYSCGDSARRSVKHKEGDRDTRDAVADTATDVQPSNALTLQVCELSVAFVYTCSEFSLAVPTANRNLTLTLTLTVSRHKAVCRWS
jgi:hypothetical protein